ncbi:ABC transporter substrate-binding protein [Frankia sp. AgB32]|uniref:ABC transporter substrate-binding protein n=1 Tax=Frankia sp. AgB32 TaxID=631119 RepID=UPI00200D7494|nr:ABC transporter substrate-binding protein [Frankia sp. AgB32]MCK9892992.1 ABC transporter substrate-binding protein [Frankia sp. AgB32]
MAPGVTADEVKVGLIVPNTGPIAPAFTSARAAVQARISAANAAGGINGRRIVLTVQDDGSTAAGNLVAARDLIDHQDVFGLIEMTAVATGSAQFLDTADVPVTGVATEAEWARHRNMFSASYRYVDQPTTAFGQFAARSGGTRAMVIREGANQASTEGGDQLSASLASQNISVVSTIDHTTGFLSADQIAAIAKAARADVLASSGAADVLAAAVQAIRNNGGEVKSAFSLFGYDAGLLHDFGQSIAGVTIALGFNPTAQSAAQTAYRATMNSFAPEVNDPDGAIQREAYTEADMFLRGLAAAGPCPTRSSFVTGLRQVHDYDAGGLLADPIDLATNIGTISRCRYFLRVARSGQSFEVVPGGGGRDRLEWCDT